MNTDRTIHASTANGNIVLVRYDRASKWFLEDGRDVIPKGARRHRREQVSLTGAVDVAEKWLRNKGTVHIRPGGAQFVAELRRRGHTIEG